MSRAAIRYLGSYLGASLVLIAAALQIGCGAKGERPIVIASVSDV